MFIRGVAKPQTSDFQRAVRTEATAAVLRRRHDDRVAAINELARKYFALFHQGGREFTDLALVTRLAATAQAEQIINLTRWHTVTARLMAHCRELSKAASPIFEHEPPSLTI